ncbi:MULTISPECIES: DNA topoisomerase IB [unclassified Roseovarius]|uniref:DNA topoisomerase IB n=1 Tax=unclassified Roseovarius TaxID=2614913 RepID=UPI00273EE0EF|nr:MULTISPECIES: DNA topoisomerase IB [unclassified Roseovarius]
MAHNLVYVTDSDPGITRRRCGTGFSYIAPDGTTIARGPERTRLEALAVPPAYDDVWMCPFDYGHILATGRDARKRKQYKYHPDWEATRSETKFGQLVDFGRVLPRIRRRAKRDLQKPPGSVDFALASAVTLIDKLSLRVGHETYVQENGSYGALTLRNRHLRLKDRTLHLSFRAKGGTRVRRQINDRSLQRLLGKINDLPGATLLSWVDDDEQARTLSSQSLNTYLCDAADDDFLTAKTFRTWSGTVAAFEVAETGEASIKDMAEAAAKRLHNTVTVARNSYIHPKVIGLANDSPPELKADKLSGLYASEQRLLAYLAA